MGAWNFHKICPAPMRRSSEGDFGGGGTANATIPAKAPQPTQRPNKHQTNKDDAALFARINKSSCDTNKAASSMDALLRTGLTPTIEVATVEAIHSVAQAQRLAQRQAQAVRVLAMHTAKREVKDQIRRQGKVKLSKVPHRQIVAMARARLFEDGEHRAKLIADAKLIVEQWQWGPRGGLHIT